MELTLSFLGIFMLMTVNSSPAHLKTHDNLHDGLNKHLLEDIKNLDSHTDNHTKSEPVLSSNYIADDDAGHSQEYLKGKSNNMNDYSPTKEREGHVPDQKHSTENTHRANDVKKDRFPLKVDDTVIAPPDREGKISNANSKQRTNTNNVKNYIDKQQLNVKKKIKSSKKSDTSHSSDHHAHKPHNKENKKPRAKVQKETKGGKEEIIVGTQMKEESSGNGIPKSYDKEQPFDKTEHTDDELKNEKGMVEKEELKEYIQTDTTNTAKQNVSKSSDSRQLLDKLKQISKETEGNEKGKANKEVVKEKLNTSLEQNNKHGFQEQSKIPYSGNDLKSKPTKPTNKREHVKTNMNNGLSDLKDEHESIHSNKAVSGVNNTNSVLSTNKNDVSESAFDTHTGNMSNSKTFNESNSKEIIDNANVSKFSTVRTSASQKPTVSKHTIPSTVTEQTGIFHTMTAKEKLKGDIMHHHQSMSQETQSTTAKQVPDSKQDKVNTIKRTRQQNATLHSTISTASMNSLDGNSISFSSENKETVKEPESVAANRNVNVNQKPMKTASSSKQLEIQRTINKSDKTRENNLSEQNLEDEYTSDDPCQERNDPSRQYTGSALIAATVGGIFIGAFAVLMLFHLKQKCKNYMNGDYRRVPMEYDFELNPRFKSH